MAAKDNNDQKTDDQDSEMSLDMSQAAVKKMIAEAREKGFITYDQLNNVLPPDQVSSEQIEDVMSMLSEMGINIIESEDAEEEEQRFCEECGDELGHFDGHMCNSCEDDMWFSDEEEEDY